MAQVEITLDSDVIQGLFTKDGRDKSFSKFKDEMMERYAKSALRTLDILKKGFDEVLTVLSLPRAYRKRLRTTNGMERLNEEIRRRDRVIRIYPS